MILGTSFKKCRHVGLSLACVIISVIALSCNSRKTHSLINGSAVKIQIPTLQAPFHGDTTSHAYELRIDIGKKQFSGLLFFREQAGKSRFSIVTKTGQKLFDSTLDDEQFEIHYILDELDKPIIKRQLATDLSLLIMACKEPQLAHVIIAKEEQSINYITKDCSDDYLHFTYTGFDRLISIGSGKKRHPKAWANFEYEDGSIPNRITIDHRSIINLHLELNQLRMQN